MSQAVALYENGNPVAMQGSALMADDLKRQVAIVKQAMRAVMKENMHYGRVPGCGDKPVLLKPGAEVLALTFQFAPSYKVDMRDLGNGHREYSVSCDLTHRPTGEFIGQGLGSASTMEGKYRFRMSPGEVTEVPVPKAYWDMRKAEPAKAADMLRKAAKDGGLEGAKFGTKKNDAGQWMISTQGERVEYDNPADYYNTCLKMAKKRAFVDAILSCTAASDCFTQDIEDNPQAFGAPQGAHVSLNLHEIDLRFGQCENLGELDQMIGALGIDKTHPDAQKISAMYRKHKAEIESMAKASAPEAKHAE